MNLNKEKQKELDEYIEDYVYILHCINLFIENNNLDYDEVWNLANQSYDEDLSICNQDN